jgi:magnesium chelatase subunit I
VVTGDRVTAHDLLDSIPDPDTTADVLDQIAQRLDAEAEGERASAVELALEGLYLARRIGKEADESGQTIYG